MIQYTDDAEYEEFIKQLHVKKGFDLSQYKENQMNRRLRNFYDRYAFKNYKSFLVGLMEDDILYEEFMNKVTINVTNFFRNPNRWEYVEKEILPRFANQPNIKCWSAACSSGEEPYTLAMLGKKTGVLSRMDILATDLDKRILEKAMSGEFELSEIGDIPYVHQEENFVIEKDIMKINPRLKEKVRFKYHNLLMDNFECEFDLIICRNVMIYFTEEAKEQLYQKFNQALKPGGIFFTGSTEQIFNPERYGFESLEASFYRKK